MKNERLLKGAIVSISLFLMSHLALAPAIPQLYASYKSVDSRVTLAGVESLVTLPAIVILLVVAVSPLVVRWLGKKRTVQLGLALIALSGLVGFWATSLQQAVVSRMLLGLGIGLYNSLSVSIIGDYYQSEARSGLIGLRTAMLNIGKTVTTFLVGYVLFLGVRYAFLVYLLALPVLWFFSQQVQEVESERAGRVAANRQFDAGLLLWMLLTGLVGISYIGATIKIPTLLVARYGYSDLVATHVLTILAFSGVVLGIFFGRLTKYLGQWTLIAMLTSLGLGNLAFTFGNHQLAFYLGAILVGAGFVGGMSAVFDRLGKQYPSEANLFVTSMVITAGNIGVALTPLLLTKFLSKLQAEAFLTPFYITAGLIVMAIGLVLVLMRSWKKQA